MSSIETRLGLAIIREARHGYLDDKEDIISSRRANCRIGVIDGTRNDSEIRLDQDIS